MTIEVQYRKLTEDSNLQLASASCWRRWLLRLLLAVVVGGSALVSAVLVCRSYASVDDVVGHRRAQAESAATRLVCYYNAPSNGTAEQEQLQLINVDGQLCTHINIGEAELADSELALNANLEHLLDTQLAVFRAAHPQIKLLLWIGGDADAFADMVRNHRARKVFLGSLKRFMAKYPAIDGVDLDWEFPSAHRRERQHFSQLLMEIRREWAREQRTGALLSVAVAAPEGIALFAYDGPVLNEYTDYINLMTYDFHFYSKGTPFTGLNAPLYARSNEHSILSTININYTVHWWLQNGIAAHRLVVGLPTYGHSFKLVNYFNNGIGAPAADFGACGVSGYTTYSQTCVCAGAHLHTKFAFDESTCSPYLSAFGEWISYEDTHSIRCKAEYIKSLQLGGVMIFSLNADDWPQACERSTKRLHFPLTETVKEVLWSTQIEYEDV